MKRCTASLAVATANIDGHQSFALHISVAESEVFVCSRIPDNTRSLNFLSDSGCPIGSFLHHIPKLGIFVFRNLSQQRNNEQKKGHLFFRDHITENRDSRRFSTLQSAQNYLPLAVINVQIQLSLPCFA